MNVASEQTGRGTGTPVVPSPIVVRLTLVLAVVVAVAAAVGLFAGGGPGPHAVLTVRGQSTQLYGTGLYRYDSWLIGVGNRGTDAVTLFLGLPVLLAALRGYRRRSLRSSIVLIGLLGWLLYYYASMSLYTAYNRLFGLYVVALGLALFAVPLVLRSIDPMRFAADFPPRPAPRVLVGYLACLAGLLTVAWAPALISEAITGGTPTTLDAYSTEVTWALDLGVVVPAVAVTAWLLHRRTAWGPLATTAMLSLNVALGIALAAQGVAQLVAGVPLKAGEIVGQMASFMVMTAVAASLLLPLLRRLVPGPGRRSGRQQPPRGGGHFPMTRSDATPGLPRIRRLRSAAAAQELDQA